MSDAPSIQPLRTRDETLVLLREHEYEVHHSPVRSLCKCGWDAERPVLTSLQEAHMGHLADVLSTPPQTTWESDLDEMAAQVYNIRAQSRQEMTPERWARVKKMFPGSVRIAMQEAQAILEEGE